MAATACGCVWWVRASNGVDAVALARIEDVGLVILDVGGYSHGLWALINGAHEWAWRSVAAQFWRRLRRQPDLHAKVGGHDRDADGVTR
jgi:hypothetical protein